MALSKVYIVDDAQEVRDALALLLTSVGLKVETFASGNEFIATCDANAAGCIILDVRMPGISGIELQEKLIKGDSCPPIIIISGHGDIPMAVKAVQAGATDFIEKPFNDQILLDSVHRALELDDKRRGKKYRLDDIRAKLDSLTPREKQVLMAVVSGKRNKVIANELSIGQSTVETHRAKVMEKTEAKSLSDLMRMVIMLENT